MGEKIVSRKTLLKSSFWYTLSMFVTRGIVFITMPIFTRLMTKQQYGDFSVFASWQNILLIVCSLELYGTLNRARFDYPDREEYRSYVSSVLVLSSVVTGVVLALYLLFPHIFDQFFMIDRKYMVVMFAYLFTQPALSMFQTTQRLEYRYKVSSSISLSVALLSPVIAVVLVLLMKDDPLFGRIIGQFSLYILLGLVFYIYFLSRSSRISFAKWKYALRMGLPLVFSYLGSRIMLQADTIVLKHMCSAEQVSYLSVTHSTSHIMLILVQTLNLAWSPWFFDMLKAENYREIRKVYRVYLWLMVAVTFAVMMVGPEIILVLGGAKYRESVYILPPVILCGVFTVVTAQFGNLETYHKKPEYAAILTGVVAVVNVGLDILGVKLWGYRAVCYTTVFCQLLLIALQYFATRNMHIRDILTVKTLILSLAVSVALIPAALLLYRNNALRYGFVAAIAVAAVAVLVVKRDQVKQTVRRVRQVRKAQ